MAGIDDMLSNFDALLAKYQTTASPDPKAAEAVDKVTWPADRKADEQMDVVQQQERPGSGPPGRIGDPVARVRLVQRRLDPGQVVEQLQVQR